MNRVPARCPSTATKYLSNLAQSWPRSVSPISLNHSLQVHLQTRFIMAFKCISRLVLLRPASSHDHGLQVHISNLARSQPPRVSPDSLDYGLQGRTIMAPKCISPNSLDHGLQVYVQTRSIRSCEFDQSWPPSVSPNSLDYGLPKCISKHARSRPQSISLSSLD